MCNLPDAKTPNEVLAEQIRDALVGRNLISESHQSEVLAKLKNGSASSDDWCLWIDPTVADEAEVDTHE